MILAMTFPLAPMLHTLSLALWPRAEPVDTVSRRRDDLAHYEGR
jgi:hypothetical protein